MSSEHELPTAGKKRLAQVTSLGTIVGTLLLPKCPFCILATCGLASALSPSLPRALMAAPHVVAVSCASAIVMGIALQAKCSSKARTLVFGAVALTLWAARFVFALGPLALTGLAVLGVLILVGTKRESAAKARGCCQPKGALR